jgi:hypothetical protein
MREPNVIDRLAAWMARCIQACASVAIAAPAMAAEFSIESSDLRAVPQAVTAAVRADPSRPSPECTLIGMPIGLSLDEKVAGYAVTTADACDWAAATGPIWLIKTEPTPSVVWSGHGYSLKLAGPKSHNLLEAHLRAATSGWSFDERWVYDGRRYVLKSHKSFAP